MLIFVRENWEKGTTFCLDIEQDDTVAVVKQRIREKCHEGTSVDNMKLVFCGRELTDYGTMQNHNISHGSKLHLVLGQPPNSCTCVLF